MKRMGRCLTNADRLVEEAFTLDLHPEDLLELRKFHMAKIVEEEEAWREGRVRLRCLWTLKEVSPEGDSNVILPFYRPRGQKYPLSRQHQSHHRVKSQVGPRSLLAMNAILFLSAKLRITHLGAAKEMSSWMRRRRLPPSAV